MTIKWFPRSWIQIKATDCVIYIDPSYLSSYYKKSDKTIIFSDAEDDAFPDDLEKGNLILISHIHKDHCKEVTINRLSDETTVILTPKMYTNKEANKLILITLGDRYQFGNNSIEVVNAYNTTRGHSTKKVRKIGSCVGYIITVDSKRIYFSGDTDLIAEMKDIRNIDVAIVPIGGTYTMDIDEAVEAMVLIKPKLVIPVHYLKADPMEFKMKLEEAGVCVSIPGIGEELQI